VTAPRGALRRRALLIAQADAQRLEAGEQFVGLVAGLVLDRLPGASVHHAGHRDSAKTLGPVSGTRPLGVERRVRR